MNKKGVATNTGRTHWIKGHTPWNKGLNKDNSELVALIADKVSQKLKGREMPKPEGFSETMRRVNPPSERKLSNDGYVWLYLPKYEGSKNDKRYYGRIYEHRYVVEQHLGRILSPKEQIHHLDGVKNNNNIENLVLCANVREHTRLHQKEQKFVEKLIEEGKVYYDRKTGEFMLRQNNLH
jgi:hypothetical protein